MAKVISGFGRRVHPKTGEITNHNGVDFATPTGSPMYASRPLEVVNTGYQYNQAKGTGWGYYATLRDPVTGQEHRVAHLDERPNLKKGQTLKPGEIIGHTGNSGGSTGPHLHYEVLNNGVPVDPEKYKDTTPISFGRGSGTSVFNTEAVPNRNRSPSESSEEKEKKSKDDPSYKPGTPTDPQKSNDPIGDLIRKKQEEEKRNAAREREKQGQERRSNRENKSRPGSEQPVRVTGSPFHRGHDGQ